jgi:hypothetical protein
LGYRYTISNLSLLLEQVKGYTLMLGMISQILQGRQLHRERRK